MSVVEPLKALSQPMGDVVQILVRIRRVISSSAFFTAKAPRSGDHCGEMPFQIKRAYETATAEDGYRVLVDRLWPRGVAKAEAKIDRWRKEIAPSTALRKWFGHDPARWPEFKRRYFAELEAQRESIDELRTQAANKTVTLVFGAKDTNHNQAVALKEYLEPLP